MSTLCTCKNPACNRQFHSRFSTTEYCSSPCSRIMKQPPSNEEIAKYFFDRVLLPSDPSDCWGWAGSIYNGYAMMYISREKYQAHRVSYAIHARPTSILEYLGNIQSMFILHDPLACHSRSCTNPKHIRIGTNADNMHDRSIKNSHGITAALHNGDTVSSRRFTEDDVLDVLRLFHNGHLSMADIARMKDRSVITIYNIIHRKTWKHVAPSLYPPPEGDGRTTRMITSSLSNEAIDAMCHEHHYHNVTFYALSKRYGITHGQIKRLYHRWLKIHSDK